MLGYKTGWNGGQLVMAGPFLSVRKTCSGCGAVKAKLALSERSIVCEAAAWSGPGRERRSNLLKLAASGAESINACGGT